jgi:hypothetical protein
MPGTPPYQKTPQDVADSEYMMLASARRSLEAWQHSEARLRVQGEDTPEPVLAYIVACASSMIRLAVDLNERLPLLVPQDNKENEPGQPPGDRLSMRYRGLKNRLTEAKNEARRLLVRTMALLRNTPSAPMGRALYDECAEALGISGTYEEFEAEQGSVAEAFRITLKAESPPVDTPIPEWPTPVPTPRLEDPESEIAVFLRNYYEAVEKGDPELVRPFFSEEAWSRSGADATRKRAGSRLVHFGAVYSLDLVDGEIEVRIDPLIIKNTAGREMKGHAYFILSRDEEMGYQLVDYGRRAWGNPFNDPGDGQGIEVETQ